MVFGRGRIDLFFRPGLEPGRNSPLEQPVFLVENTFIIRRVYKDNSMLMKTWIRYLWQQEQN